MRSLLFAWVLVGACSLPSNVRYRCEADATCSIPGQTCGPDGFCHPPAEVKPDAGDGSCIARDVSAECAAAECGFINDGCRDVDCNRICPGAQDCTANHCALPSLCTAEGWCWENPLPQGYSLNASWKFDARHTWFVGENHVLLFHDGEKSSLQFVSGVQPARTADLFAMHGTSPRDVFAVGTQGTILFFDGTSWTREQPNTMTTTSFRAVFSFGDGGALVGGNGGALFSRRGQLEPNVRWAPETLGTNEDVRSIFAGPNGDVLVLDRRNQLFARGLSGTWERFAQIEGLNESVVGVAWNGGVLIGGSGNNNQSLVWQVDGGAWQAITTGFQVMDLVEADGGIFVLGERAQFAWLESDGGLLKLDSNLDIAVTGVPFEGHTLFIGGASGAMANVDLDSNPQTAVTMRSSPIVKRGHTLNAICGASPEAMYALGGNDGQGGNVRWLERSVTARGVEWNTKDFSLGNTTQLEGCFAEAGHAWFTGDDSKFIQLVGGTPQFSDFTGSFGGRYVSAWGSRDAGYYFVRENSGELVTSPTGETASFNTLNVNSAVTLRAVWDFVAVGQGGGVSRFDGVQWNFTRYGNEDFAALHGVDHRYLAAGSRGSVATFDSSGDASVQQLELDTDFEAAFMNASGTSYVAGAAPDGGGAVWMQSSPGAAWVEVPFISPRAVRGMTGFDDHVWIVGPRGAVLRR